MDITQNLHTHSIYCDGKDTPEEMVQAALAKGYESIGFSGHSYVFYSDYAGITMERQNAYVKEIHRLKQVYGHRIRIYLGLEVDIYAQLDLGIFDYLIGSMHYMKLGEEYVSFDDGPQEVRVVIDRYFGGDGNAYVKEYFRQLAELPKHGKFDIIGHFDLISKHVERSELFDYDSDDYLGWATETAEALLPHIPYFEVNTGAMARGYRTTPYPSPRIARMLKELGFRAVITTDCHDASKLDWGIAEAKALLESAGFREHYVLTDDGFRGMKL